MIESNNDSEEDRDEYKDAEGNRRALTLDEIERTVAEVRGLSAVLPEEMEEHITRDLAQRIYAMLYQAYPAVDAEWSAAHEVSQTDIAEVDEKAEQIQDTLIALAAWHSFDLNEAERQTGFKTGLEMLTNVVEANAKVIRANWDWEIAHSRRDELFEAAWEAFEDLTVAYNKVRKDKSMEEKDVDWFLDHPNDPLAED